MYEEVFSQFRLELTLYSVRLFFSAVSIMLLLSSVLSTVRSKSELRLESIVHYTNTESSISALSILCRPCLLHARYLPLDKINVLMFKEHLPLESFQ